MNFFFYKTNGSSTHFIIIISQTLLHSAAQHGCPAEIVEILLLFGTQLAVHDDNGQTALMMAVRFKRIESVQLFLSLNADTTMADRDGWNVSQTKNDEMRQLLLEHSNKSVRRWVFCLLNRTVLI